MGVFHVFEIVQMVLNRVTHHILIESEIALKYCGENGHKEWSFYPILNFCSFISFCDISEFLNKSYVTWKLCKMKLNVLH